MANPNYDSTVKSDYPESNPPPYPQQPQTHVQPPYPQQPQPYPAGGAQYVPGNSTYQQQPNFGVPTQTIIFTTHTQIVGPNPQPLQCPHCNQQVITVIDYENGNLTWLWVGGLFLVGCWLGCCLIPTCVNELKDVTHVCPNCHNFLGRYKRI